MRRTYKEQVWRGLRLVALGIAWFLLLLILLDGIRRIADNIQLRSIKALAGFGELLVGITVLWLYAHIWSRYVYAFAFLAGLKGVIGLIAGTTLSPPFRPISRLLAAETIAYCLAAGFLTMRFSSHRPTLYEKFALILLIVATGVQMLFERSHLALLLGLGALAVARVASVKLRAGTRRP